MFFKTWRDAFWLRRKFFLEVLTLARTLYNQCCGGWTLSVCGQCTVQVSIYDNLICLLLISPSNHALPLLLLFKTSGCHISGWGLILKHSSCNKRLCVNYYSLSGAWKAFKTFAELWRRAENNLVTDPRHFNLHPRQACLAEKFSVWPEGGAKANIWNIL